MSAETWEETYKRLWSAKVAERKTLLPSAMFASGYAAGLAAGKELAAKIAEENQIFEDSPYCKIYGQTERAHYNAGCLDVAAEIRKS